jgi:small-conductance mechanosensitive channel
MMEILGMPWVQLTGFGLAGIVVGMLVERVVFARVSRFTATTRYKWDDVLLRSMSGLLTIWFGAIGLYVALSLSDVELGPLARAAFTIVLFGSVAIAGMRFAGGVVEIVSGQALGMTRSPTLVANLARLIVAVLGLVLILQNLGIDITPLITALGIGGLAVALALQDTLGNLFAGVHIILSRQVRPFDHVRLSTGDEGKVIDVRARNTTIETGDGSLLVVPNSTLATSIFKNHTLPTPLHWVTVDATVSYENDLERVERVTLDVAREVLAQVEGGVVEQEPTALFRAFGPTGVDLTLRVQVRDFPHAGRVRHELVKRLHRRFAAEGVGVPHPPPPPPGAPAPPPPQR